MTTQVIRPRVPDSTVTRLSDASARLTGANGKPFDYLDVARLTIEIGLRAIESCEDCAARRRCATHVPGAGPQASLPGLPAPPEATPAKKGRKPSSGEPDGYQATVDLYFAEYERARRAKPVYRGAEGKAIKRLIRELGIEPAHVAIRAAYADQFWKDKATILTIAKDPGMFLHAPGRSATVQRSEKGKTWERAPEVRI